MHYYNYCNKNMLEITYNLKINNHSVNAWMKSLGNNYQFSVYLPTSSSGDGKVLFKK